MDFKEKIQTVFKENKIEILSYNGEKKPLQYKCLECGQIYNLTCARNIFGKITLCGECYQPMCRWKKEYLQERINRIFPTSEVELIKFESTKKNCEIKCLKCGKIEQTNNIVGILCARKDKFCFNCEKETDTIYKDIIEKTKTGTTKLLEWNGVNVKNKFQCTKCGHIFYRNVRKNIDIEYCPNCHKIYNKFTIEQAQERLNKLGNQEYIILQFKNFEKPSLIKHKCGFIYKTRLSDFNKTRGCPKCYKKVK